MTYYKKPRIVDLNHGIIYSPKDLGLPFPEVMGISIGKCVTEMRPWDGESAHAHCDRRDPQFGYICVRKAWLVWAKHSWRPRDIMWHEYAHILDGIERGGSEHDARFKEICSKLLHRPWVGRIVV